MSSRARLLFEATNLRWMAYAGIGLTLLVSGICYLYFPLGYNQALYHYVGTVLRGGGVPYKDFIDIKGPLGLWFYALPGVLLGPSEIAYRLFDLAVMLAIGFGIFKLVRLSCSALAALLAALIWFIHFLMDGPGNTGDVTNLITLAVVIVLLLLQGHGKNRFTAIGATVAAAALVKPTAILLMLPATVWCLLAERSQKGHRIVRDGLLFLGGAALLMVSAAAFLFATASFKPFYETVVIDAFTSYVPHTQLVPAHNVHGIGQWLLHDPVFRVGGLIALFLAGRKARIYQITALGGMTSVIVQSRFFPYHFSPILPLLAIGCILGWSKIANLQEWLQSGKFATLSVSFACILLLAQPLTLVAKDLRIIYKANSCEELSRLFLLPDLKSRYSGRLAVAKRLRPLLKERDTLYVLGSDVGIYLELDKVAPFRHANPTYVLYDYGRKPVNFVRSKWRSEILAFMQENHSDWLVVDTDLWRQLDPEARTLITAELGPHYKMLFDLGDYRIYQRLPHAEPRTLSLRREAKQHDD